MPTIKDKKVIENQGVVLKDTLVIVLLVLVVAVSCLPLFRNIHNINLHFDWLQMVSYYRAGRECILKYNQFPFRTHYFGGGYPLLANPQDGSLNPFFIPVLIFGEVIGLKINAFLVHLICLLGMYYLTRYVLRYDYLGASFSSLVFCLGGHLHRLLIRGQDYISCFYSFFIPLLLALVIKSKEHKRYLFYSAFIFTIIATQAGLYFAPIALFIFLFSILQAVTYENKRFAFNSRYIKIFFIIILLTFLLGAVKIFPMLGLIKQNSRYMDNYTWNLSFRNIYESFLIHQSNFPSAGQHWNYFYLGYLPIILSLLSFQLYWQKTKKYFVLLVIFALLSFGSHTRLDLFRVLWQLPIFHSIGEPTRYFIPLVIFIITLVSGQVFSIREKIKTKFISIAFILVVVFTTLDLFLTNGSSEESFSVAIPKYTKQLPFFLIKNTGDANKVSPLIPKRMPRWLELTRPTQYELILQNIGKINAYTNIHLGEYATPKYYIEWNGVDSLDPANYIWHPNPDYKGEIYFLNHPNNKAEFQYFSPNKLIAKVSVFEPDTLIINQNYGKYWRSDLVKPTSHNGLLAINLHKQGEYLVQFNYVPISFYAGLGVSLITLIFSIYYLARRC